MQSYQISAPFADSDGDKSVTLAAAEGTPFYAAHAGTVKLARWDGGYGYTVIVDVGNNTQIIYCHASKLLVREGQTIASGDLLALTGNTGYAFEPGLHFEVRVNGTTVDPIAYLQDHGVDLTKKTDSYSLAAS
jgi:murein DD-endopeptidase MepM/ murein hydrolase activator NlpD